VPVAGRPALLRLTDIDFDIIAYNVKAGRGEAYERNFHSALTQTTKRSIQMAKADRVHSTPPTNTSAIDAPKSPAQTGLHGHQGGARPMAKAPKKKKAAPGKRSAKAAGDVQAKQVKAYADMEPYLCDLARMSEIAAMMFDKDEGLFIFATTDLDDILKAFRARYYAMDFPPV